jgi:hypothetical protein
LIEGLSHKGIEPTRIKRFGTLRAFVDAVVPTARQYLDQLERRLSELNFVEGLLDLVNADLESFGPWVDLSMADREFTILK